MLASPSSGHVLGARHSTTQVPVTSATGRPAGPAADLSQEITGGNGPFVGSASKKGLNDAGYGEREYVASGTATSYRADGALSDDGRWTFVPDGTAAYRTRVLVRRPAKPAAFSGTVVVEWLNVSGGLDADPDYTSLRDEILRQGHVWVGVSAQLIGLEGGPVIVVVPSASDLQGKGLKAIDPTRYGSLAHPGDSYSFDMYTQVARAIRAGGPAMGGLKPKRVIAIGESQSALALTTYINGVQPLTHGFDGFFVHSRASVPLPLVGPGEFADLRGGIITLTPTILRTDTDVPVLELQAESDVTSVLESVAARQPDTDRFRLWEVAGTAHADDHLLGSVADTTDCGAPINNGPMHIVAKAALRGLDRWIRTGEPPPKAPRLQLTSGATPEIRRNADGIARGGVRTPPLDVPVEVLSGVPGPDPALLCLLLGSTEPLSPERLAALYPSRSVYEDRYDAATQKAIKAGFVLKADRAALQAFAIPSRVEQ
ncbi:MAG: alpha/beta hydrolase domain-containing protein [Acidimicrobiia bacterium]